MQSSVPSSFWRRISNLYLPDFTPRHPRDLNDVTIVTEQEIQNASKVQTVTPRVDTILLLLTVGPQVYNLILEYSNIYAELFSFGLVFEKHILSFVSVTAIAPQWVTHWIYKHSVRRPLRCTSFLNQLDFRSFYPTMHIYNTGPYNADFDGDEMNLHIPNLLYADTDSCLFEVVDLNLPRKQYAQSALPPREVKEDDQGAAGRVRVRKQNSDNVVNPIQDDKVARRHTRHENKKRGIIHKQPKAANKSRTPCYR